MEILCKNNIICIAATFLTVLLGVKCLRHVQQEKRCNENTIIYQDPQTPYNHCKRGTNNEYNENNNKKWFIVLSYSMDLEHEIQPSCSLIYTKTNFEI